MDPTLIYIVSWTAIPPNMTPVSYVVRMKESQAKRLEEILEHLKNEVLIDGAVEEAGELLNAQEIMSALKAGVPGAGKEWMP